MKKTFFILLLIISCLSSCKKLVDVDKDFIGDWKAFDPSFTYEFILNPEGDGSFKRTGVMGGGEGSEHYSGTVRISLNQITIGSTSPRFKIIEKPFATNDDFSTLMGDSIYRDNNIEMKLKYSPIYGGTEIKFVKVK